MDNIIRYGWINTILVTITIYYLNQQYLSLNNIDIIISVWSLKLALIYGILSLSFWLQIIAKNISITELQKIAEVFIERYIIIPIYLEIGTFALSILMISRLLIYQPYYSIQSSYQISFTLLLFFLVFFYQETIFTTFKFLRTIEYLHYNLILKHILQFSIWVFGMFFFATYMIFSFNLENGLLLSTMYVLLSFTLISHGQKIWRINNKVWLIMWIIPISISINFCLDYIYFYQKSIPFFKIIRPGQGIILFLLDFYEIYLGYKIIKQMFKQQNQQIQTQRQRRFYLQKLQQNIKYSKKNDIFQDQINSRVLSIEWECTICTIGQQNQQFKTSLKCGHYFHQSCIKKWIIVKLSCPNCRAEKDQII